MNSNADEDSHELALFFSNHHTSTAGAVVSAYFVSWTYMLFLSMREREAAAASLS